MNFIGRKRSSNLSTWQELVSTVHRDAEKLFCQTTDIGACKEGLFARLVNFLQKFDDFQNIRSLPTTWTQLKIMFVFPFLTKVYTIITCGNNILFLLNLTLGCYSFSGPFFNQV